MVYIAMLCFLAAIVVFFCHYNFWRIKKNPLWPRILMYHNTSVNEPVSGMNIHPETLRKQIEYLISKNYAFLKISELSNFAPTKKHVVLTFDDGFVSNYTYLFPLLKKYNIPVTIYLSPKIQGISGLNEQQIIEMQESGLVEFGAHTLNHINLTNVDDGVALQEITESKLVVEKITKIPCLSFAYPYGRYEQKHVDMVKNAGFTTAVTVKKQIASLKDSNHFTLPRLSVTGGVNCVQFYLIITRGRFKV